MTNLEQSRPIVSLSAIEHSFTTGHKDPVKVLDGLALEVYEKECIALLGPAGSGKTTLLRMIAGLIRPDTGNIAACGIQPTPGNCGIIFQANNCFPWLTVRQNVEFALPPKIRAHNRVVVSEAIAAGGVRRADIEYPVHLSGGMQQRAALARMLLTDKRLWLLDEPFNALDPPSRFQMRTLLYNRARQSGRSVILVTHDIDEALEESDRVVMLTRKPTKVAFVLNDVVEIRYAPIALAEKRRALSELYEGDGESLIDQPATRESYA